ncbi:MAG: O-antigen ligase family protein [Cyanobacteria bacterium J06560_5]
MQSVCRPLFSIFSRFPSTANLEGAICGRLGLGLLLSFTWLPNSYTLMVSWPYCLWWQGGFCLLLFWSLWLSRQFNAPFRPLAHRLDGMILLIGLSSGLSALFSQFKPVAGLNLLLLINYGVVLYLLVHWLRQSPAFKRQLWQAAGLTGSVTCLISLASWRPTLEMWSTQNFYTALRNPLPLGHHNFVGGYCLLLLPVVIGLTLVQEAKSRWLGYIAIALNALALYASGSRGALLGAIALTTVASLLTLISHPPKTKKHWILCGLLCLMLVSLPLTNPRIRTLVEWPPTPLEMQFSIESLADSPTKDRLFMLQAGQKILQAHPILGVGPGNLSRIYTLYRPASAGAGLDIVQQLHNTPAQLLAELGLLGFTAVVLWLTCLLKLGLTLSRQNLKREDRILLYSIGASWFAYGVSSLTDYQLENIGIASTLLITTALLIHLADTYLLSVLPAPWPKQVRRYISLGLLLWLSIMLQGWARQDTGFFLTHIAQKNSERHHLIAAHEQWAKAADLVPWDPTYATLSAEQLIAISEITEEKQNKEILLDTAIASLEQALVAAPNDPWFNQNLAFLLIDRSPAQAEQYLQRTIRLSSRSQNYTYYLLARAYLNQNEVEKAMTALTLEAIANPAFLINPVWRQPSFSPHLTTVVTQTLFAWQQILSNTVLDSSQYAWLSQQIALIKWWYRQPLPTQDTSTLSPFIQAVISVDSNPALAIERLTDAIEADSNAFNLHLLRAWLSPDAFLPEFLATAQLSSADTQSLTQNIQSHRDLRNWLTSVQEPAVTKLRYGLTFAYRNAAANNIRDISFDNDLYDLPLLSQFGLFSPAPREFFQLDQSLVDIGVEKLSLLSPAQLSLQKPK